MYLKKDSNREIEARTRGFKDGLYKSYASCPYNPQKEFKLYLAYTDGVKNGINRNKDK